MSTCARIARSLSTKLLRSIRSGETNSRNTWTRPKPADRKLHGPDVLEYRETVSDTFFVALQAAGASLLGGIAAEKARDPFGLTNPLEVAVSDAVRATAVEFVRGDLRAPPLVVLASRSGEAADLGSGVGLASGLGVGAVEINSEPTAENASGYWHGAENGVFAAMSLVAESALSDAVAAVTDIRHTGDSLMLPPIPVLSGMGSGSTASGGTDRISQLTRFVEIPSPSDPAPIATPVRDVPAVPTMNGKAGARNGEPATAELEQTTVPGDSAAQTPSTTQANGTGTWTADAGMGESHPGAEADASGTLQPAGKNCLEGTQPTGGNGSSQLGGTGSAGLGPVGGSCTPPGPMALSSSDPLFVLNWNDGLVAAPGVVEFDKPGDFIDLRAQVYGKTVSSYSWDLSQASNAGCSTGTSTYRLKFHWNTVSGSEPATNTVSITATMTDQTQLSMTLTFKVEPGSYSCSAAGTSATWPNVLTPDKPLEGQAMIASDSATRPYAVSAASGAVYVSHSLPAYNPGMPALELTYSSLAAERKPIFVNRYELDPSAAVPNTVSARLRFDGTWGSSKYYDTSPSTMSYSPKVCPQIVNK